MHTEHSNIIAASSAPQAANTTLAVESKIEIPNQYEVIRRNGKMTNFDISKIQIAVIKAFLAVEGGQAAASRRIHDIVEELAREVAAALFRRLPDGGTLHIEEIQDQVELALMRNGHHKVARAYVLYREQRAQQRAAQFPPGASRFGLQQKCMPQACSAYGNGFRRRHSPDPRPECSGRQSPRHQPGVEHPASSWSRRQQCARPFQQQPAPGLH